MGSNGKMLAVVAAVACVALAVLLLRDHGGAPDTTPPAVPAAVPLPPAAESPAGAAHAEPEPVAKEQMVHCVVRRADDKQAVAEFQYTVLPSAPATPMQEKVLLKDTRYVWTGSESKDGTFAVAPLKVGESFAVGVRALGYQPAYVTVEAGQPGAVVLLSAQTTVAGSVQSPEGTPIGGAAIVLGETTKDNIVARSGPDGRFDVTELPPGEIQLTAEHPDYEPASVAVTPADGQVTEVKIVMPAGGRIEGVVTKGGKPLPKAFIIVYDAVAFVKNGKSDETGRYVIKGVPAGPMEVECQVRMEGLAAPLTKQLPVMVEAGRPATASFDFPAALGSVGGVVTLGGQPAGKGMVRLTSTAADGDFFATAPIQADGAFAFEKVPPGDVTLEANAELSGDVRRTAQVALTLKTGEKVEQNIEIGGLGVIEGKIQNAAADKTYHVMVFEGAVSTDELLASKPPAIASLAAGKDGVFRVDKIAKGTYTVVVMAVSADAEQTPQDYGQSAAASVSVTVEDNKTSTADFTF